MDPACLRQGGSARRLFSLLTLEVSRHCAAAACLCLPLLGGPAGAQHVGSGPQARMPVSELDAVAEASDPITFLEGIPITAPKPEPTLPPEATSRHSLTLPDRTLSFT